MVLVFILDMLLIFMVLLGFFNFCFSVFVELFYILMILFRFFEVSNWLLWLKVNEVIEFVWFVSGGKLFSSW